MLTDGADCREESMYTTAEDLVPSRVCVMNACAVDLHACDGDVANQPGFCVPAAYDDD